MRKTAMAIALVIVALIGYAGLKAIDLGTDYAAHKIAKGLYQQEIRNRRVDSLIVLPCIAGATDTDVVRTGRLATRYLQQGLRVEVCGKEVTMEMALEMSNY